jgi:hypothetical protein
VQRLDLSEAPRDAAVLYLRHAGPLLLIGSVSPSPISP